jgi:hypothetical protein
MQHLMQTVKMVEAEWRQVLWGSMSMGELGLLDFNMLQLILAWWVV